MSFQGAVVIGHLNNFITSVAICNSRHKNMQKRLEFHISYVCPNNCVFCSEKKQLEKFEGRFIEKDIIEYNLTKSVKEGFGHITFTGGEPTLHPDIVELTGLAKSLGYKTYIGSNGGLFSSKIFCDKILPYLDEVCLSIHGPNADLHNFLTKNKRSFSKLKKALTNIDKYPRDIFCFINIVVTKYNFDCMEQIINFVGRYKKVKQVLVSNLAPEGNGLSNFEELSVPLEKIKRQVPNIVKAANKKSLNIRFFGMPTCILDGYEIYSNDIYWSPRLTLEKWKNGRKVILKKTYSQKPSRKRVFAPKCGTCSKKGLCSGVFKKYVEVYGDDELG
jgi:MoaA/NifB/PqqE/SkfB family radical SAM enzyme